MSESHNYCDAPHGPCLLNSRASEMESLLQKVKVFFEGWENTERPDVYYELVKVLKKHDQRTL